MWGKGGAGRGEIYSALFWKLGKNALLLEKKNTMSVFICRLNSYFKDIKEKKTPFSCGAFLSCVEDKMLIEVPLFQETFSALKIASCVPGTKDFTNSSTKINIFIQNSLVLETFIHSFSFSCKLWLLQLVLSFICILTEVK